MIVILDGGRYSTPAPEWGFLKFGENKVHADYALKYFTMDSASYKLNKFLYNEKDQEEAHARRRFFEVVLLFKDDIEKENFLDYVYHYEYEFTNKLKASDDYFSVNVDPDHYRDHIIECLKTGKVLNQMLLEFRSRW